MKFRTEITPARWAKPIGYDDTILCLGSCFATNIAERLTHRKFRVYDSAFGILFNPASIAASLERMIKNETVTEDELINVDGRWLSYHFHSELWGPNPVRAIADMHGATEEGLYRLSKATHIIITLGTAWVYRLKSTGKIVANCHKQPHSNFSRELLTVAETVEALESIVANTYVPITFTVSPVRHIGEGAQDNSLSKAILRVAVDEVCRRHADRVGYFPAYEIMMDDLRDYRFYADDLVHPSSMAVDYIADKFFDAALNDEAKRLMPKVLNVVKAAAHRPANPDGEEYRRFCRHQLDAIAEIEGVDLSKEKTYFERALQINL